MIPTVRVSFDEPGFAPVDVPVGAALSEHLDVHNAPVLFGCRTGLCGTCVSVVRGELPPPSTEEAEVLELEAPDEPGARLLCQLRPRADLCVARVLGRR